MKLHRTLLIAMAVAVIATPLFLANAAAGPLGFNREDAPMREIARTALRHALNFRNETPLSEEQKEKIAGLLKGHRDEIRAQVTRARDARRAMEAAVKEHGAEAPEARAAADQIGQAARDRALLVARILTQVRPVLTAEQQDRVKAAREELQSMVDEVVAKLEQ